MRRSTVTTARRAPDSDQTVVLHGIPWGGFEAILAWKGEAPVPRIAYIGGELELMSPSRTHERIKSWIGRLVEACADEAGVDLSPYGSWTLKNAPREAGAEPDECYILGTGEDKEVPDLVIEVVWTSGGLDKLEIYRRLGVGEFWQWRDGRIQVFILRRGRYVLAPRSRILPGLDLEHLAACLDEPTRARALRRFRAGLA